MASSRFQRLPADEGDDEHGEAMMNGHDTGVDDPSRRRAVEGMVKGRDRAWSSDDIEDPASLPTVVHGGMATVNFVSDHGEAQVLALPAGEYSLKQLQGLIPRVLRLVKADPRDTRGSFPFRPCDDALGVSTDHPSPTPSLSPIFGLGRRGSNQRLSASMNTMGASQRGSAFVLEGGKSYVAQRAFEHQDSPIAHLLSRRGSDGEESFHSWFSFLQQVVKVFHMVYWIVVIAEVVALLESNHCEGDFRRNATFFCGFLTFLLAVIGVAGDSEWMSGYLMVAIYLLTAIYFQIIFVRQWFVNVCYY
ncbi:unnamed protein product [Vitrella brassicaformis CCMP3155]|uniref:Uncharacterized protein n=2 Tax=Vitrella brassicaformis TaxID=1169539 RepID=A0A0G4F2W8_VITBC|nr:unnamed protein product [Vitrella brassicaformis CCMP3155]|mmetsp:Transcript_50700/g.127195  ORF Transcript_50700/g.127195 Transcript_50700/m.127195 type:complete len:305 (+) Transcript_50700:87-1001(+)|eukprot:CEM05745.1 unnamed protein product [Vitrella brassicaformis CCMP3155]